MVKGATLCNFNGEFDWYGYIFVLECSIFGCGIIKLKLCSSNMLIVEPESIIMSILVLFIITGWVLDLLPI